MKRLLIYFSLVAIIFVVFSYYLIQKNSSVPDLDPTQEKQTEFKKEVPKEPTRTISTATLAAVGDILIHDRVYNPVQIGKDQYDFMPLLSPVQSFLADADITVANQETMIGGVEVGLSSYPSFNSPHEVGDALKKSGVDLVTLANNHTLDRGEKAIQSAVAHWNKIDMPYTGAFLSTDDKINIRTIKKNGIIFSFLAYTYGTNGIPVPEGKSYLVNLIDKEIIEQEILRAKEISDIVVVSLHFGNEYERIPSDGQKEIAYQTANAGADIIIGHHSHVLQPMEWITREDGKRTFVAYSLGNFLSGQLEDYRGLGGIMRIKVEKVIENDNITITLKEPSFILTYVSQDYTVYPLNEVDGKQNVYDEIRRHMNQWMPELTFSF